VSGFSYLRLDEMKRIYLYLAVVFSLAIGLWISACNMPGSSTSPQISPLATSTAIMNEVSIPETLQAVIDATQTASSPAQDVTPTPSPSATPVPTITQTSTPTEVCFDKAEFVKDITVPDGTLFSPGDKFVKTWRLRNVGTCTWTELYQLVFVGGDPMGGASSTPISEVVPQGETIDLSISLTAPTSNGNFQSLWQLQNPNGVKFGIGEKAQKPFWVKINVAESVTGLELKSPTWQDTFKSSKYWYLLDTANTHFSIKNGRLIMKADTPGKRDEWGIATQPDLTDFYIEATFKTGKSCEGKDRYGLLVRATNPNSGYIFSFACDGSFRVYRWDGENYVALQEWKQDSNIYSGHDQINRMGVLAQDTTLKLYANGKILGEYEDDTFLYGQFGLMIGSEKTHDLTIYVEDIAYWLLED